MTPMTSIAAALLVASAFLVPSAPASALALNQPASIDGDVQRVKSPLPRDQGQRYHPPSRKHTLSADQIIRIIYERGYRDIRIVQHGKRSYTLIARGHRGFVRLVVSRYSGAVLSHKLIQAHDTRHYKPGSGWSYSFSFGR